jgi:uroporphyrinogen-III decarboxylase
MERMKASSTRTSAMTARERVIAAMNRRPVDYVPCCQLVNPLTEVQRRGHPWNFPWPAGDGTEYMATVLGLDPVVPLWWMGGMCPDAAVSSKTWREGGLLHKAWETPAGTLHASVTYNDTWPFGEDIPFFHDFAGHYHEVWVKTQQDVDCLGWILRPPSRTQDIQELREGFMTAKAFADRLGLATMATVGSGLTGALWLFGAERLCLLTVDDPGLVESYVEMEHRWNLAVLDLVLDWGADIIRRNGFYESADFYGPSTLARFLDKPLRAEIRRVHEAGRTLAYTMYSGIVPILDFLAGFDIDCIASLDIAFDELDLAHVAAKLPGKSFWTGPSNTFHMYQGPAVVRKAVRDTFAAFGKEGLVLGAASSVHPMMPWENTLAMIDEWKTLRAVR